MPVPLPWRTLDRPSWRVPGDPEPLSHDEFPNLVSVGLSSAELDALDLILEQGAIPEDLLEGFLEKDKEGLEQLLWRFLENGLIQRAKPLVHEPNWVWLTTFGVEASRRDLGHYLPSIGRLEWLRAESAVRLMAVRSHPDAQWFSSRVLRRAFPRSGSLPTAILKVGEERQAIDVFLFMPPPEAVEAKFARRVKERHDRVVWFRSARSRSGLETFIPGAIFRYKENSPDLRPLPRVNFSVAPPAERQAKRSPRNPWPDLAKNPVARLRRVDLRVLPIEVLWTISDLLEVEEQIRPLAAWRKLGRGARVYCIETAEGNFRVIRSRGAWRADEIERTDVFRNEDGSPVSFKATAPLRASSAKPRASAKVILKPEKYEFSPELWEELKELIPLHSPKFRDPDSISYSDQAVLSGILWVLRNRTSMVHLPPDLGYGTPGIAYARLRYWEEIGVWPEVRELLRRSLPDGDFLEWRAVAPSGSQAHRDKLNSRQLEFLDEVRRSTQPAYTVNGYEESLGVSTSTAQRDLRSLVAAGLLSCTRSDRGYIFTLMPDLVARLKARARF